MARVIPLEAVAVGIHVRSAVFDQDRVSGLAKRGWDCLEAIAVCLLLYHLGGCLSRHVSLLAVKEFKLLHTRGQ